MHGLPAQPAHVVGQRLEEDPALGIAQLPHAPGDDRLEVELDILRFAIKSRLIRKRHRTMAPEDARHHAGTSSGSSSGAGVSRGTGSSSGSTWISLSGLP